MLCKSKMTWLIFYSVFFFIIVIFAINDYMIAKIDTGYFIFLLTISFIGLFFIFIVAPQVNIIFNNDGFIVKSPFKTLLKNTNLESRTVLWNEVYKVECVFWHWFPFKIIIIHYVTNGIYKSFYWGNIYSNYYDGLNYIAEHISKNIMLDKDIIRLLHK